MELRDRVAVVTGAASGIGLAMSERFAAEGMKVIMADIEADVLERESARLAAHGASVTSIVCDVADTAQIEALRDAAVSLHGTVHLLCNNAGVAYGRPAHKTSFAAWRWVVDVNLLGVAYGVSAFAPLMIAQGEGHIVNTASEAGLVTSPALGSYHATKFAVVGLSEALSMELAGTGVNVSCLCPELVETKIFEATRNAPEYAQIRPPDPIAMDQIEAFMNSKAMDPADVAGRVVYAVRAGQFWILTHTQTQHRVAQRNRDLETFTNPRYHP